MYVGNNKKQRDVCKAHYKWKGHLFFGKMFINLHCIIIPISSSEKDYSFLIVTLWKRQRQISFCRAPAACLSCQLFKHHVPAGHETKTAQPGCAMTSYTCRLCVQPNQWTCTFLRLCTPFLALVSSGRFTPLHQQKFLESCINQAIQFMPIGKYDGKKI